MILDQQQPQMSDGLAVYPTHPFVPQGNQGVGPGPVNREVIIVGGSVQTTSQVQGNVDDAEN